MFPEASRLVPGLPQHVLLRLLGGGGEGVSTDLRVTGDGLNEVVKTDERGEVDLLVGTGRDWRGPRGGSLRRGRRRGRGHHAA